jgi:hypothetical protein
MKPVAQPATSLLCRGLLLLDLEGSPRFHRALLILLLSMELTGDSYVECGDQCQFHRFSVRALANWFRNQDNMSLL